jgi:hypothetical protein
VFPAKATLRLTVCAVVAGALAGCSDHRIITADGPIAPATKTAGRSAVRPSSTAIGERLAAAALDDSRLNEVRGGFSTESGLVVSFSFQEATYVNHNLSQSIAVPTITVSPGSAPTLTGSALAQVGNLTPQMQNSPIMATLNNGVTGLVSNLGGGGVTDTVSNTVNNQLIQQLITANIGITGLSKTIQQNMTSTVASRLAAANSQFR